MKIIYQPGLGEQLRHLLDLVDGDAHQFYKGQGFAYRPRYTPIMRILAKGPCSIKNMTQTLAITQGAVSQTIQLMEKDQLILRQKSKDARESLIQLSEPGEQLLRDLENHWQATFVAIEKLQQELGFPLLRHLSQTINALQEKSFIQRIKAAESQTTNSPQRGEIELSSSSPLIPSHISSVTQEDNTSINQAQSHFQSGGKDYAQYRPSYPKQMVASLANLAPGNALALDIGTGSGQLSVLLSDYFQQVVATDVSADQLNHALPHPQISYRLEPAENINLPDQSVDLIVAAQAAHWFELEDFYSEVKRVARPQGILALISYGVPYLENRVNATFQQFYWQKIAQYWPPQRQHVENGYSQLPFPFQPIPAPEHFIYRDWTLSQLMSYIKTWSATKKALKSGNNKLLNKLEQELMQLWGDSAPPLRITWPVSMRIGRIE